MKNLVLKFYQSLPEVFNAVEMIALEYECCEMRVKVRRKGRNLCHRHKLLELTTSQEVGL